MKYQHIVALAVGTVLLAGGASFAFAENGTTTATTTTTTTGTTTPPIATTTPPTTGTTTPPVPTVDKREYKLEIGPMGRVNVMRGNIESISGDTIKVRTWGGVWTVKVLSGAEILPHIVGTTSDLSKFMVGDYVGVQGTISTAADFTVDARIVRDWTERKTLRDDRHNIEQEMRDRLKDAQEALKNARKQAEEAMKNIARTYEGSVATISGSSFTFTKDGTPVTVNTSSSTKFINKNWNTIAFGDIKTGDSVRVFGVLASSTINADVIRDVSVPR